MAMIEISGLPQPLLTMRGKKLLTWTGEAGWGRYKIKHEGLLIYFISPCGLR
jgi:hypothetical protein